MEEQVNVGPAAPAGWYRDPGQANTQRYWDGAAWTDQRAPVAQVDQGKGTIDIGARGILGLLGAALAIAGVFLPWTDSSRALHIAHNSMIQGGDGFVVILFAAGAAAAALRDAGSGKRSWPMVLLGAMTLGFAYYDGSGARLTLTNGLGDHFHGSAGIGVWAVGIGGVLIFLAGIRKWEETTSAAAGPPELPAA